MEIDYKREKVFPLMFIIIGITCMICGLIPLFVIVSEAGYAINLLSAGILFLIGSILVFTRKGTLININNRKMKYYVGFVFIKIGFWKSIEEYSFISIRRFNRKSYGYSQTMIQSSEIKRIHQLCLLNENHRKRLVIAEFNEERKALKEAEFLSKKSGMKTVLFNPS